MLAEKVQKRPKAGRPPTGIGPAIGLRLYPEMDRALDDWIADQPEPRPKKPDAIRQLLSRALRLRAR